jgi:uncharacterized protein with HEPN domain
MTPQETQEIFLQHIIASLQNDITYLESLGSNQMYEAAVLLREAMYTLQLSPESAKKIYKT